MSSQNTCRLQTLARNPYAHVQQCVDCHCVSVHLGPVTIRLDAIGLEALWAVLGEAARELRARRRAEWSHATKRSGLA